MQTVLRNLPNKLLELIIEFNKATGDESTEITHTDTHTHIQINCISIYWQGQSKNKIKKTVTKASNRIKYLGIDLTKALK